MYAGGPKGGGGEKSANRSEDKAKGSEACIVGMTAITTRLGALTSSVFVAVHCSCCVSVLMQQSAGVPSGPHSC